MKSFCIKSNNPHILNYLLDELQETSFDDLCYSCHEFKNFKNIIIHYTGNNISKFIYYISNILSCVVIDEFDESIIKNYIFHNHFYFSPIEREEILKLCFELCLNDNIYYEKKRNILLDIFYKYISNNKSIILSGFVNFRLYNYRKFMEEIVDEAINNFIVEREYLEFISLLKLYISSQHCNINLVHLIYYNNYSILLDENKKVINISDDIFKSKYLSDITFSLNDCALNALLTLLPKKLYIHLVDNYSDEFINTLKLIFDDKIYICNNCDLCTSYKNSTAP